MLRHHLTWQSLHSSWPSATPDAWLAIQRRLGNFRTYYGLKHYSRDALYTEYRAFCIQPERSKVRSLRQVFSGGDYRPGAVNKKARRQHIKQRRQARDHVAKRGRPKKVALPASTSELEAVQSAAPLTGSPSEPRFAASGQAEPVPPFNHEPTLTSLQSELMLLKQRVADLELQLALPAQALSVAPRAGILTQPFFTSSPPVPASIISAQQTPSVFDGGSLSATLPNSANPTDRHESIEVASPLAFEQPTAAVRGVIVGDEAARLRQTLPRMQYDSLTSAPLNLSPYLPSPLNSSNWPYARNSADTPFTSSGPTSGAGVLASPPSTASSLFAPSLLTGAQSVADPGSQRSVSSFDSTGLFAVPTPTFSSLPSVSILATYSSPLHGAERVFIGNGESFENTAGPGRTQTHMAATRHATGKRTAEGGEQTGRAKRRRTHAVERLGVAQDRAVGKSAAAAAAYEHGSELSESNAAAQDDASPAVHQLLLMSSPNAVSASRQ